MHKDIKDLFGFAFLVLLKCERKYAGDDNKFYLYLNKSIQNAIANSTRKKKIKFERYGKNIESYGYEQAFNDEVQDFRKFVLNSCSKRASIIMNFCIDQPLPMRLYCYRHKHETNSDLLLMLHYLKNNHTGFDTVGICRALVQEIRDARDKYNSL